MPVPVSLSVEGISKGSFPHFRRKETKEEVGVIARLVDAPPPSLDTAAELVRSAPAIKFVGAGMSYHAGLFGQLLLGTILHRDAEEFASSEFEFPADRLHRGRDVPVRRDRRHPPGRRDRAGPRRPGHRAREHRGHFPDARRRHGDPPAVRPLALRGGDQVVHLAARGPEPLVQRLAREPSAAFRTTLEARDSLLELTSDSARTYMASLAHDLVDHDRLRLIGRGGHYVRALEAALKIKEVAGFDAQAFPGGEMKHGPLALAGEGTPAILFYDRDQASRAELAASELFTRGATIYTVGPHPLRTSSLHVRGRDAGPAAPLPQIVPRQLLAYELAKLRHLDPDRPKNLAKSVTGL